MTRPGASASPRRIEDSRRRYWAWHHDYGLNLDTKSGLTPLVSWLSRCAQEFIVNETSTRNESKTDRTGRHAIGVRIVTGPQRENGASDLIVIKR